jgi:hypothetical protein
MVPVSRVIIFFQVGVVNNGQNCARIAIMGLVGGMDLLLETMSFG